MYVKFGLEPWCWVFSHGFPTGLWSISTGPKQEQGENVKSALLVSRLWVRQEPLINKMFKSWETLLQISNALSTLAVSRHYHFIEWKGIRESLAFLFLKADHEKMSQSITAASWILCGLYVLLAFSNSNSNKNLTCFRLCLFCLFPKIRLF